MDRTLRGHFRNLFRLACGLAPMLVTACATVEGYRQIMRSWDGSTEERLVDSWGPPTRVYTKPNGDRILTYFESRTVTTGGYQITEPVTTETRGTYDSRSGDRGSYSGTTTTYVTRTTPVRTATYTCSTSFTVSKKTGRIIHWSFKGHDCRAEED